MWVGSPNLSFKIQELCIQTSFNSQTAVFSVEDPTVSETEEGTLQVESTTKSMLVGFFDICNVLRCEFIPEAQPVDVEHHCDDLRHLSENIQSYNLNFGS